MPEITREEAQRILNLPMQDNDADAATIREYLVSLVREVWRNGERFSGKRPFGNSGWDDELHQALVRGGVLPGAFDEYDCLVYDSFDEARANALIFAAIDELERA